MISRATSSAWLTSILAAALMYAASSSATVADDALGTVRAIGEQIRTALQPGAPAPEALESIVIDAVLPRFDLERISTLIMGSNWDKADAEQRAVITAALRRRLVDTYVTALTGVSKFDLDYQATEKSADGGRVIVDTQIREAGKQPVTVRYRMRNTDAGWKGYDVVVEGISMIRTFRTEFMNYAAEKGLPALVERLRAEVGREKGK